MCFVLRCLKVLYPVYQSTGKWRMHTFKSIASHGIYGIAKEWVFLELIVALLGTTYK